jgi:predicted transcriptional regulator
VSPLSFPEQPTAGEIMRKIHFSAKVDPELVERMRRKAKEENRTISNLVDTAIRRYVERDAKATRIEQ